jgi:hypothetical protein
MAIEHQGFAAAAPFQDGDGLETARFNLLIG